MRASSRDAGEERDDEWRVGELHDRECPGPSELGQTLEPLPQPARTQKPRVLVAWQRLAAVGRWCDLTATCLLEVCRQGRVGGAGEDGQADAPADDRGALSCLRVGQVGEFAVGEAGDERAQVGVLEHVGVGVGGVESPQLGGWRIDRCDIDRVGRKPLLSRPMPGRPRRV